MTSLIVSDKKILSLIESLTTLNLVDVKVSVRLFTYQLSNPRVYLMMCLQILRYQDTNLWNNAEKLSFQPILDHITMYISVSELLELGSFLMLSVLGSVHNDDIVAINSFFLKWSVNESKLHWCIGAYDDSETIFFLMDKYLKYFGWLLSDKAEHVRIAAF